MGPRGSGGIRGRRNRRWCGLLRSTTAGLWLWPPVRLPGNVPNGSDRYESTQGNPARSVQNGRRWWLSARGKRRRALGHELAPDELGVGRRDRLAELAQRRPVDAHRALLHGERDVPRADLDGAPHTATARAGALLRAATGEAVRTPELVPARPRRSRAASSSRRAGGAGCPSAGRTLTRK
jgi:hypothetical protein